MNKTSKKRWNGKIETLAPDYLTDVTGQMQTYGERVQFALSGSGPRPNYQVINTAGKKIAFDSNNHLLTPKADEFVGSNATGVFTLAQIQAVIAGGGRTSTGTRVGSTRSSAATVKAKDLVDAAKYEYFKNNRQTLPAGIEKYSDEIAGLMKNGLAAEDAFAEVIKRHF